jgi:hypothetical protein
MQRAAPALRLLQATCAAGAARRPRRWRRGGPGAAARRSRGLIWPRAGAGATLAARGAQQGWWGRPDCLVEGPGGGCGPRRGCCARRCSGRRARRAPRRGCAQARAPRSRSAHRPRPPQARARPSAAAARSRPTPSPGARAQQGAGGGGRRCRCALCAARCFPPPRRPPRVSPALQPTSPSPSPRRPSDAPPPAGSSSISVSAKGDAKGVAVDVKAGGAAARASYALSAVRK